jgi:hypothetical protein
MSMSRALTLYALVSVAIATTAGLLLTMAFSGPGDAAAIRVSAVVVVIVQLVAFGITRHMIPKNMIAGWGTGTLVRFVALVTYALIVAKLLPLPLAPALVSMAALFFLTTLVEPLLLKR